MMPLRGPWENRHRTLDGTPLFSYQGSNNKSITLRDDYFGRYENNFSNKEWGDEVVDIEAGGKYLSMDLENISISTNYYYFCENHHFWSKKSGATFN